MESVETPGFAYDAGHDRFVAWNGGAVVYLLDPDTGAWTEELGAGPEPTPATPNGTFTRWQYSECHDVFVGVNAIDEPVWIYRVSDA